MANPAWFNEEFFAGQKLLQMKILGQEIPAGDTPLAQLNAAISAWDAANPGQQAGDPFSNFEACNTEGYIAGIPASAINVSPNALFDIPYYLTAAAKYANDQGYTAAGFDGPWTAETVLQHMYEGGYSAWAHFMGAGLDERLDCSADFSTSKYIAAKAEALNVTEDEVVAQMKADGLNPVMDYYVNGIGLNIDLADLKVDPADVLNVDMNNGDQWGTLAPADPYDDVAEHRAIAAGDTGPYEGKDGVNTQFDAKYVANAAETTLSPDDVISGGAGGALNTLAVELGRDWGGFNGIGEDGAPNVTGVGRIKIDRQTDMAAEQKLTFDATGISDDAVQYDINAAGTGVTNLQNLSGSVARVNYANQVTPMGGGVVETTLGWQTDAHAGKDDSLTIGLNNVCENGNGMLKVAGLGGIENLTVDSRGGAMNNVDVSTAENASVINVTGAANVNVRAVTTPTLKTLDASEATGNVQFTLTTSGLINQTITGGAGRDTVAIDLGGTTSANVNAANWSSIESVVFSGVTGTTTSFNAQGAQGIEEFWMTNDGTYNVRNLAAKDVTVYQTAGDKGTAADTINGSTQNNELGNIKWVTASGEDDGDAIKANFTSNATGTAAIEVTGKDTLADESSFTFSKAANVVINASNAGTYAASKGVILDAAAATSLDMTLTGAFLMDGSKSKLDKLQNLTVNLTNTDPSAPDSFDMSGVALAALLKGTINADGENVKLGAIGSESDGSGFTLTVNEAHDVTFGTMGAKLGGNINVTIADGTGHITLGNITTSTNQTVNGQGDVNLDFTTTGNVALTGATTVKGGDIKIDFTEVLGNVADSTNNLTLSAQETIQYKGALGADYLTIGDGSSAAVDEGSTSVINTGLGDDTVTIKAAALANKSTLTVDLGGCSGGDKLAVEAGAVASGTATLNVVCGDGADEIDLTAASGGSGKLVIRIEDLEAGDAVKIAGPQTGTLQNWVDTITGFGLSANDQGTITEISSGKFGYLATDDTMYILFGTGNSCLAAIENWDDSLTSALTLG